MLKLYILFIALFIVGIQIFRRRLLTSVTVWVGCYCCYFIIAPLLLNDTNSTVDCFALIGIISFLIGYILVSVVKGVFPFKCNRHLKFGKEQLSTKRYRIVCDYMLFLAIALLILSLGKDGLREFLSGQLAAKDYLIKKEGIFVKLYSSVIDLAGYMILYLFIKDNGKMNRKFIARLLIYSFIIVFFSFTRATIILLFAALFLYKLRNENTAKQIFVMMIIAIVGTIAMILMGTLRIYGISGLSNLSIAGIWSNLANSVDFTLVYKAFQREIEYDVHISALVYLKPLFMIIPRTLWNNKPFAATIQILSCIDPDAMARGYSEGFTILGEGYAVWGEKGMFILPFLWSVICTILDEIYIRKLKNGKDIDFVTCGYVIFMSYTVIQGHRMGSDAVMVVYIIDIIWLYLSSKVKLMRVKLVFHPDLKLR